MRFLCAALCLALCPAVLCDYRVEIELGQYSNPSGRLANGECCDLAIDMQSCHPVDTCDVQFIFMIQNFVTGTTFPSQTKGVGRYDNRNEINFPNCAELPTTVSVAATNPLTFIIPSSAWTGDQMLRMRADIQDYDPPVGSQGSMVQQIASPTLEITRPSSPSETFSDTMIIEGPATITLRYRVICTSDTCGDDCSLTTGCPQWSPACSNITSTSTQPPVTTTPTSSQHPCLPVNPCQNGGICEIYLDTFRCDCPEGYSGDICDNVTGGTTTAMPSQSIATQTETATDTTPATTQGMTGTTSGGMKNRASHWVSVLVACMTVVALLRGK